LKRRDSGTSTSQKEMDRAARGERIADLDQGFSPAGIRRRRRHSYWNTTSLNLVLRVLASSRRLFDLLAATAVLTIASPILFVMLLTAKKRGGGFAGVTRIGRWGTRFRQFRFEFLPPSVPAADSAWSAFAWLPSLWNVLKGEMAFIGPRPVSPHEIPPSERAAWKRFDIRPGFICLWWIRKRANIAYSGEMQLDAEYAETHSFWGDLGIALRAVPAIAYGEGASLAPDHFEILNVPIHNLTMSEAVEQVVYLAQGQSASQLCFVNADCVNIAYRDRSYHRILTRADIVLADGIGIRIAGRVLNCHIRENVNGTDLFPILCDSLRDNGLKLFLLGGRPGVPEAVAAWAQERYPGLQIAGFRNGYLTTEEEAKVLHDIRQSGADVLLVAFGVPFQEQWIAKWKAETGAKVSIGVGGLFDFYSGRIPRAPIWIRELGMEWFYRFIQEPGRMWKRYFVGNAIFLFRVIGARHRSLSIPTEATRL
jgi:N-acetylglucosaminyldiphosphoundecaprenol N-acetyl-beta-D-mannosaminyltransferase